MTQRTEQHGGRPAMMKRAQEHGITSLGIDRSRVIEMFGANRFDVLSEGESVIHTIAIFPNGEEVRVPAHYMVLRPKVPKD